MKTQNNVEILGKYCIIDNSGKRDYKIFTDNPLEAVWEANKFNNRIIENICGERQFYKEGGKWHIVK